MPVLASFLHLVLVEVAPVYAFYISFIDMLCQAFGFWYLWTVGFKRDAPSEIQNVGEYAACVFDDIWLAAFSLNWHWKGSCVEYEGWNVTGYINLSCVLVCCATVLWTGFFTAYRGGTDVCSGRFLVAKMQVERSWFYKLIGICMVAYIAVIFVGVFFFLEQDDREHIIGKMFENFLMYQLAPVIVVAYSAVSLAAPHDPKFEYESEEFRELRFRRSWYDLISERSIAFVVRLERAVLYGHAGFRSELEHLLMEPADVDHVLRICAFRSDEQLPLLMNAC